MRNTFILAVVLLVFSVVSAVLIYTETVQTNEILQLRAANGATGTSEHSSRPKRSAEVVKSDNSHKGASVAASNSKSPLPDVPEETVATETKTAPKGTDADDTAKTDTAKTDAPGEKPAKGDKLGASDKPATLADEIDNAFDRAGRTAQAADEAGQAAMGLTEDEERLWGKRMHEAFLKEHQTVENQEWNGQMLRVAQPLLKLRLRRGFEYKFTVVESDDDDLNAFSMAGGYVYVHSGLMKWVKSDAELQFVIGHEIGHIDLGHCASQVTYAARASQVGNSTLANTVGVLHGVISRAYTKDQEFDADRYGLLGMLRSGRNKDESLSFARRFQTYLRSKGVPDDGPVRDSTAFGTLVFRVNNHFQTHPNYGERVRRLEKLADDFGD